MSAIERKHIVVEGRVQGVGFRPHVFRLARALALAGSVSNRAGVVEVEVEGPKHALDRFVAALRESAPPLARVDVIQIESVQVRGERGFHIAPSANGVERVVLTPDTATCEACLAELLDPRDRHFGYPFSSCTSCGPRLTIVLGAPWDRERTTMRAFAMCAACRAEYDDPDDRRFHAQPIACPACGPQLVAGTIEGFARALTDGAIGALKGIGGYHLVCDARRPDAVARLRERKGRPHEPLALLLADLAAAERHVSIGAAEASALTDPSRPIVLCRARAESDVAPDVAPGLDERGVMLPYSGLHHLLVRALPGVPLVMTSANRHGAPMIHRDDDASRARLAELADVVLSHDRPIALRVDDSVMRSDDVGPRPVRLGRGLAPLEVGLPARLAAPTVALGGHLKAAFAFGREATAVIGPHVGDLDDLDAERSYEDALGRLLALHHIEPARAIVDRHPDYATRRIAERLGVPIHEVWHHHAHLASCMAEHRLDGDVVGAVLDGAGLGPDGTLWGGEILVGGYLGVERAAHLRAIALAGGERAIAEPWRIALAYLLDAGIDPAPHLVDIPHATRRTIETLVRSTTSPRTSSAGRLFDAVAYLTGLVRTPTFEAHGPMWLEAAASRAPDPGDGYPFALDLARAPIELDARPMLRPLLADVGAGVPIERIAARFHAGLADAIAGAVTYVAAQRGIERLILSGGAFVNVILSRMVRARLPELAVYEHRRVPPNDGGLAYGQLAIAAARDAVRL
ncbi:MAG: carbamoyltransferase HypF [Sandaracinaceae bacterium]